jgi:hypothetical protein
MKYFETKDREQAGCYSGDDRSEDNVINLFRPVSARPPVNEMISAGSSNIMLVQPSLQLELFRTSDSQAVIMLYGGKQ